jgi:hypothetical protein
MFKFDVTYTDEMNQSGNCPNRYPDGIPLVRILANLDGDLSEPQIVDISNELYTRSAPPYHFTSVLHALSRFLGGPSDPFY